MTTKSNLTPEAAALIDESIARLKTEIKSLEDALSVSIMEDSHALTMTDEAEPGAVRIFGDWQGRGKGFADLRTLPWHICGTSGYYRENAKAQVAKANAAETKPGVKYGYIHFRSLREHLLAERRRALLSISGHRLAVA
jgi:hypothetical protein